MVFVSSILTQGLQQGVCHTAGVGRRFGKAECLGVAFGNGVEDLHLHKLRHTFASIAIANGADIAAISRKLGHANVAITLRIYIHANDESEKRASETFREAIARKQA